MNASSLGAAEATIQAAQAKAGPEGAERIGAALALLRAHPEAFDLVRGVLASVDHQAAEATPDQALAGLARAFDRAATRSPGGSSALYALGDDGLLARATDEVVAAMTRWGLVATNSRMLEVGCGSGRFVEALAPRTETVIGVEISAVMAKAAQARTAHLANAAVVLCSGNDLGFLADRSVDLVLYADSFPYLIQAGGDLAARHILECARVLKPQGRLLILNASYRGDVDRDLADLRAWGEAAGLETLQMYAGEFQLWDATAFLLG